MNTAKEIAGILGLDLFTSVYSPKGVLYVFDDCACAARPEEVIETAMKYAGNLKESFVKYSSGPVIPAGVKIAPPTEQPGTIVAGPAPKEWTMDPATWNLPAGVTVPTRANDPPPCVNCLSLLCPGAGGMSCERLSPVFLPGDGLIGGKPAGIESELARQLRTMPLCYVCDAPGAKPRLKERGTPLCDRCADQTPEPKVTP